MSQNYDLLKKLCAANAVSGNEGAALDIIADEIKDYVDDYRVNALGSLVAHKKGPGKKMMLAGHADQIGLIITFIDKEGFLHFSTLGGFSPNILLGQRFVFPNGTLAVCGSERLDDPKDLALDKMYLDIGAIDEEDAKKRVKIGDTCTYSQTPEISGNLFISPALDDRVGCFIMIEALKKLQKPEYDLYFVFSSQEEVGLRGARTSAYEIGPDYGLAFDVTISMDVPKARKLPQKLYGGAAVKIKDSSLLCSPLMINHLEKCAQEAGIKYQYEILEAGGTDAGAIHLTKGGVPTGVISVSTRYVHTSSEMCVLSDIDACVALTVKALETKIN